MNNEANDKVWARCRRVGITALKVVLVVALMVTASLSLAGLLSSADFVCELLSHFRILWCIVLAVLAVLLLCSKLNKFAVFAVLALVINCVGVVRLYVPESHGLLSGERVSFTVLQMNVCGGTNKDYRSALDCIAKLNPDVIAFSETSKAWCNEMHEKLPLYPNQVFVDNGVDGLAVFSRFSTQNTDTRYSKVAKRPRLYMELVVRDTVVAFEFAHPLLPVIPEYRNEELREIGNEAAASRVPIIVAGDLNCTPWSHIFSKLLADGKLHDSELGFGPQPTFNAFWLLPLLPLDHCLTSEGIVTLRRSLGPAVGSDHLPVFVKLSLPSNPK